ncbi:Membrane transport protein [Piscirickettsia salmonis]|uniref:AEC family transporter n=1 Tax=Piscirickettsia salmonis TaxID=1238 RepID=UPI0012BAF697|nr:AEC family transporter [Piscirickettsia salmonis]QGP53249.1 Membrane transport protein [Piscirickettsia salmonis]QGP60831.1 Membrane transport protein [Piscirickettsia salmonis]QGP62815.1 Membrane transport protein [Piscirickettsia salmonis]
MAVIWLLKPFFKDQQLWVAFIQGSVRYNSYVFIGVTFYYIGQDVMPIIALITAFLVVTTNVISVAILNIYSSNKKSIKGTIFSTLKNPLIVSCIAGLVINQIAIYFPIIVKIVWINNTLNNIGLASLALSLMGVGASLKIDLNKEKLVSILTCSFVKLILLPAVVILTLKYFQFDRMLIEVCVIYAGSPCSSNATPMTQAMGGDYKSMSLIISVQTLLSMLTLSAWLALFHWNYL